MRSKTWAFVCALIAAGSVALAAGNPSDDFYNAIRSDDTAAVDRLVKAHGVNLKDSHGSTPLMYAAAVGSEAMMERLIDAGADVNARNSFDATALHWCGGGFHRIKILVDHGAMVNVRSRQGHTPVMVAAGTAGSLPAVQLLVSKGASLAWTPPTAAPAKPGSGGMPAKDGGMVLGPLGNAAGTNDTALVKFIVETGGAGALAGPNGPFALTTAASFGNLEVVKLLLAKGVDVNSTSPPEAERVKNGPIALGSFTPLLLAVAIGNTDVVRTLLDAGANLNAQDVRGLTPLMLAVATDHPNRDIVRLLLSKHPDTKIKSKAGETALDWALKFEDQAIVAAVREASPGVAPMKRDVVAPALAKAATPLAAMQKSLPLLQKSGVTMFAEGGCISCHGGNIVTAAVAAARRKGVAVDEKLAADLTKATRLQFLAPAEGMLERTDLPGMEIVTNALSALADEGVAPDRATDAMVHNIAAQQLASGSWASGGIVRPPTNDSIFSTAAFAIRAFKTYAPPARKAEYDRRAAAAARAIGAATPVTTDDRVTQLLGLHWSGAEGSRIDGLRAGLLALQRPDGGWGQTPALPADAYATGTVLYALAESGLSPQSPDYQKGVRFLLNTQAAEGSWHVVSRAPKFQPYFDGHFPYGHDQWISQWATGWATIALARTLPDRTAAIRP